MSLVVNHNLMAMNTARHLNGHYGNLSTSTQRLASGLRINSAADDAAGLAIRELMRADITTLNQGVRNANDAISLIQTADGAMSVIDEKLIRMKELAEQAATGTYNSTQRQIINQEFLAMGSEIDRIAHATDFNGIKLLDGSLEGRHDGSGLNSTGELKVHFGVGNDSAEDYYYIGINDSTLVGLGLAKAIVEIPDPPPPSLGSYAKPGEDGFSLRAVGSGIIPMSYIPEGARNVKITIDGIIGAEDDIQIFTTDGYHLVGTGLDDYSWNYHGVTDANSMKDKVFSERNGFDPGATYQIPNGGTAIQGEFNDGTYAGLTKDNYSLEKGKTVTYTRGGDSMTIFHSPDYDRLEEGTLENNGDIQFSDDRTKETVIIDNVTERLNLLISGIGIFDIDVTWDYMPPPPDVDVEINRIGSIPDEIDTQEKAQQMLDKINASIAQKDNIRAHLGALQNRLENTITNLQIQAENLQASESRISDVDVATEMTDFVRNQILTQSAVSMLSQANSLPQMALSLIGG